jgi:hypothetical protein
MSLSVDGRHCGAVYVIRCRGRIAAAAELLRRMHRARPAGA